MRKLPNRQKNVFTYPFKVSGIKQAVKPKLNDIVKTAIKKTAYSRFRLCWCVRQESNLRPSESESDALSGWATDTGKYILTVNDENVYQKK